MSENRIFYKNNWRIRMFTTNDEVQRKNDTLKEIFNRLKKENEKNIILISSKNMLGEDVYVPFRDVKHNLLEEYWFHKIQSASGESDNQLKVKKTEP